jgi:hypothetical protein
VPRRTYGLKGEEVTEGHRKLQTEDLRKSDVVRGMKTRDLRKVWHVA